MITDDNADTNDDASDTQQTKHDCISGGYSNNHHLKTMQDISKSFGKIIDLCVLYFVNLFQNFLSTIKAFSDVVSLVSLTTFIHPFFSVYHIYSPVQIFK